MKFKIQGLTPMKRTSGWWVAVMVMAGAVAARGATWAEWQTSRGEAVLQAELRPGWVVEAEQKYPSSSPETYLEQNRGYDGELVLSQMSGVEAPEGPLTVHLWHVVVHPDQMNWPKENSFETNFVPDVQPEAVIGRPVAEETWTVAAEFPLRVPVVRPRSCQSPATWRSHRPAALFGGYEVRDATGREVCRGMLPPRRLAESRRSLVGMTENDATLKRLTEHSGAIDLVGNLPDELEAYRQVRSIWFTEPLWEKMTGREALLRRLLLGGVRITGKTGLVERIQATLGTGKDGRAVLEAATPGSLSAGGPLSLRSLNLARIQQEGEKGPMRPETSVFENEANLFAKNLDSFVIWTWVGWLVFAGGVVAILSVVFFRCKGERRVAVWWALPGWTVLCAVILWGGGKLVLDRQPRADVTEYRLAMAGWPDMHCRAVATAMTFEPGRPAWVLPQNAVTVENRHEALDGWWARRDVWTRASEKRLQPPRKPTGMTIELEAGWSEPTQMPVLVEDGVLDSPGRWLVAGEDVDGVYALVEGKWHDLGPMKAGDRVDPQQVVAMEQNRVAGLPTELHDGWSQWTWRKPCPCPGREIDPADLAPRKHDWIVVAWKRNTAPRVYPSGDKWRKQGRTVWVEQCQ